MDSSFALSTSPLPSFAISKASSHYVQCSLPTRLPFTGQLVINSFNSAHNHPPSRPSYFSRPSSVVDCHLKCVPSKSASSSSTSSGDGTLTGSELGGDGESKSHHDAIILDVERITSHECAATVKRILEKHPQVYVAITNEASNNAIVWPVPETKVVPNWQKGLGEELQKYLTRCGFKTEVQDLNTFCGSLKNTPYSDWGNHNVPSLSTLDSDLKSIEKEVEALKVKAKDLLLGSTKEFAKHIEFLNLLCRLGLSYHFEDEINEHLHQIFTMLPEILGDNDHDLCTIANFFRLLRQYGYNVSCDVFETFKDKDGEFKKDLANDVPGILSLYEACFLSIPGEDILDEALSFTRKHLQVLAENSRNQQLQKYISTALMFPSRRNAEYIDALYYISFYQEDESANETLLRFAKLNFNGLQLRYKRELAVLSQWWKDENFVEKFPYTRHRFIEAYMFSVGFFMEPEYHFARMLAYKYTVIITVMDDTYDTCGTIEQLQLLTTALERMTVDAGDELPKYMKNLFKIIFEDLESNGMKGCSFSDDSKKDGTQGRSYKNTYFAETIKEFAMSYLAEAKWKHERKAPSFDEYIKNGKVSGAYEACAAAMILAMENMGMKEILWVRDDPAMVDASKHLSRLINDLTGVKDPKERRDFPKGVDCYMKQYSVSEDEAVEAIQNLIDYKWKVINEEMLKLKASNIPKKLLDFTLSYGRMSYVMNGPRDGYTFPGYLKELLRSMFIEPLPM